MGILFRERPSENVRILPQHKRYSVRNQTERDHQKCSSFIRRRGKGGSRLKKSTTSSASSAPKERRSRTFLLLVQPREREKGRWEEAMATVAKHSHTPSHGLKNAEKMM